MRLFLLVLILDFRLYKEIKAKEKSTKHQLLFLLWSSHYSGLSRVSLSSYRHSDLLVPSCFFLVICQVHCLSETSYDPTYPFPHNHAFFCTLDKLFLFCCKFPELILFDELFIDTGENQLL